MDSEAPGGAFWDLAAAVCRAIRDDAAWPTRTTVPEPPDTGNVIQDCLNAELGAMLDRALRWHAANPGRRPEIPYAGATAMSPCRYRIYDAQQITDEDTGVVIALRILVPAGDEDFVVTVNGQQVDDDNVDQNGEQENGLDELVVWLERSSEPRTLTLAVFNGRGEDNISIDVPGAGNTSSPSPTGGPATSGSPSATSTTTDEPNGETGGATSSQDD